MGEPKLLLPWNGEALICQAVRTSFAKRLAPLVVVKRIGRA
jgi:CTP:molybdopterin cytidylyltransferase MocA